MSFWDMLKGATFLEVVEWLDSSNDTLVWRFPVHNQAITDKSRLVVREGQRAVFVSEGRLSDVFEPGTHTLDTRNTAILSFFRTIAYEWQQPYKGDVYFVSTRQFTDNAWGTPAPTASPMTVPKAMPSTPRLKSKGLRSSVVVTGPSSVMVV